MQIEALPQNRVDEIVSTLGWWAYAEKNAQRLAALAYDETGMGELAETCARHRNRVLGTLRDIHGVTTLGAIEIDPRLGLRKLAKPIGVIAAITPATAPTAAIAQNALLALKTRNAVVFCPHPKTSRTAQATVELLRAALREAGAPVELLQIVPESTRQRAEEVMAAADLILAAGGAGVVHRAYRSGKPAYGAGTGNAVVIVDETAALDDACEKIYRGKAFDNGTSCSSESSVIISERVWHAAIHRLREQGAHLCEDDEVHRLRAIAWPDGRSVSRAVVGRHAEAIARLADIRIPPGTRVLMAAPGGVPGEDPLGGEKLSPILTLWKFREFPEAIELVQKLTAVSGRGHSCGIHTQRAERVDQLAHAVKLSRVMVNQSTGFGNSGSFSNGMAFTTTLSCGSWGGSVTNDNITWRHLLNYTCISEPIAERMPDENLLFAAHWARLHKAAPQNAG